MKNEQAKIQKQLQTRIVRNVLKASKGDLPTAKATLVSNVDMLSVFPGETDAEKTQFALAAIERAKQRGNDDNLSGGEFIATRAIYPCFLEEGREISKNGFNFFIDNTMILDQMLKYHNAVKGIVNPVNLGAARPDYTLAGTNVFLGVVFSFDNINREGSPGVLTITDKGSGLVWQIKAIDNRVKGVIFCSQNEERFHFNDKDGVHVAESNENFVVVESIDDLEFATEGLDGEIYPILPTKGLQHELMRYVYDGDYDFSALCEELIESYIDN
jgi:hypothetical protein